MEAKPKKKRDYSKLKLIALVSLVWITIGAIGVSTYVYGQIQYNNGVSHGIDQTRAIYGNK